MDILQSAIDNMAPSPMMIVGDMNAPLPTTAELSRCWYRKHPYNKHGFVLYVFLRSKDLEIVDFNFKQDVPYTVFNSTSNTYIDHVFSSNFAADAIKSCSIISNSALNVSDHYSLHTLIELCFKDDAISSTDVSNDAPSFPRINWSDSQICSLYSKYVNEKATQLPDVKSDEVKSRRVAVGLMCNAMVTSMYASSSKAITSTKSSSKHDKNHFRSKKWWSSDCLITRDKQRFWYGIWRSCGRPRQGQVYACYKATKKLNRAACEQAMNCNMNRVTLQLYSMYRGRDLKKF